MKTLEKEINCERKESGGFTRTELLAIIATSAMLAVLLLPAVARGAAFVAGWAICAATLTSPLCNLGVALFSARVSRGSIKAACGQ